MKQIKVALPDAVAEELDKEAKKIGLDDAAQYIAHKMTEKVVYQKESENELKEEEEMEGKFERKRNQRIEEEKEDSKDMIDYVVTKLKEAFGNESVTITPKISVIGEAA